MQALQKRSTGIVSIDDVPSNQSPMLKDVESKEVSKVFVSLALSEITLTCPVTDEQIMDVANIIVEEYPETKLPEIQFFIRQFILGKYGERIHKIDGIAIIQAWEKYYTTDRAIAIEAFLERKRIEKKLAIEAAELEAAKEKAVPCPPHLSHLNTSRYRGKYAPTALDEVIELYAKQHKMTKEQVLHEAKVMYESVQAFGDFDKFAMGWLRSKLKK